MTLWKCTLSSKLYQRMPDMVEYLRSPSDDRLITMFEQCEHIEGSVYYGYKWQSIEKHLVRMFPEVHTIKVDI